MQQFAAYLSLATVLAVACLVPMGFAAPMNGAGDAILLIYLLTLCGICTLLAGLGGRLHVLARRHQPRDDDHDRAGAAVCNRHRRRRGAHAVVPARHGAERLGLRSTGFPWSGLIMLVVMLLSFQAFVQRVPFDISEAETELMEGPLMEYSGPKLALFKYAQMAKLVIYSALFVALFVPWGSGLVFPLGWLLFWAKVPRPRAVRDAGGGHARALPDRPGHPLLRRPAGGGAGGAGVGELWLLIEVSACLF